MAGVLPLTAFATPALALDLTRLTAGIWRASPRGVDRVELLYARHLLSSWDGPCFSVVNLPWGGRLFNRAQALRGLAAIEAVWGEDEVGRRRWGAVRRVSKDPGRSIRRSLPANAIYLNVGHMALSWPGAMRWLEDRPDVSPVFMLHDLIPLEHPQYVTTGEAAYFQRLVASLKYARGLILNSDAVAQAQALAPAVWPSRILVQQLPVPREFLTRSGATAAHPPYFVACGQLEPRKNFQTLINAWRILLAEGRDMPILLIAGAPGHASADLQRALDTWDKDRRHVRLEPNLTTQQLRNVMSGSTALLAPSLAEGFGLPVVEALALGIPVLASDIAPYREVAADKAHYLPTSDPIAWAAAIRRVLDEPAWLAELRVRAASYTPLTTDAYFQEVETFLRSFAA